MEADRRVIHSDRDILGGAPVFVGTRVPLQALLDYLEAGRPLDEFLEDFPSVTREQAVAALEQAKQVLVSRARTAGGVCAEKAAARPTWPRYANRA